MNRKTKVPFLAVLLSALALVGGAAEEEEPFDRFSIGLSGTLLLPQGGSRLRRVGGASLRGGYYLTENLSLEGETAWLEDAAGLSAGALWHWQGASLYGDLFGYSRLDPFFTVGAKGWIGRRGAGGQVGPKAGIGTFYHLTDSWALRADADATLGLDGETEVDFTVALGAQYSF